MEDITWSLNYTATHPSETIKYHTSVMVLHVGSDASYISVKGAKSRVGGNAYIGSP